MQKILLFFGICASLLRAQDSPFLGRSASLERPASVNLWGSSVTALAVANAIDIHSSWGKHELNPTLANPSGKFGRDGALLKLGMQGGLIGIEYVITRGHPSGRLYKVLSFINFGAAAAIGGAAIHNYTVPRP